MVSVLQMLQVFLVTVIYMHRFHSGVFLLGGNAHEIGREYFDKESLLHGRKKDHGKGSDASFRWVPSAEGIGLY